jgi:hypothetical protein
MRFGVVALACLCSPGAWASPHVAVVVAHEGPLSSDLAVASGAALSAKTGDASLALFSFASEPFVEAADPASLLGEVEAALGRFDAKSALSLLARAEELLDLRGISSRPLVEYFLGAARAWQAAGDPTEAKLALARAATVAPTESLDPVRYGPRFIASFQEAQRSALLRVGRLSLEVEPAEAELWVDGRPFSSGAELPLGEHWLRVSAKNFIPHAMRVSLPAEGLSQHITLQPDLALVHREHLSRIVADPRAAVECAELAPFSQVLVLRPMLGGLLSLSLVSSNGELLHQTEVRLQDVQAVSAAVESFFAPPAFFGLEPRLLSFPPATEGEPLLFWKRPMVLVPAVTLLVGVGAVLIVDALRFESGAEPTIHFPARQR